MLKRKFLQYSRVEEMVVSPSFELGVPQGQLLVRIQPLLLRNLIRDRVIGNSPRSERGDSRFDP